jgi:hypothetical protein
MLADSEIYSHVVDFIISARAEIFLFFVAILAHLLLFGNVFPRRTPQAPKKKKFDPDERQKSKAAQTAALRASFLKNFMSARDVCIPPLKMVITALSFVAGAS